MKEYKDVIVYGGAGFLGSHVADALADAGYNVKIFDLKPSPFLRNDQEMIIGDLLDKSHVIDSAAGCSYVYNFAGMADIDEARDKPAETAMLNVIGNLNTLEAARIANAKRFVFASTVYVFSDSGSFYRASKQSAEKFIEAYQEMYGLNYTILRYGSLYGRRSDARNGIYRLIYQALVENRMIYKGDPEATREYIHVQDASKLSVDILIEEFKNQHLVLTGQERVTLRNMMTMISEMLPDKPKIAFDDDANYAHYVMTPYSFSPSIGKKIVSNVHIDLGQGILDCIKDIHQGLISCESRTDIKK